MFAAATAARRPISKCAVEDTAIVDKNLGACVADRNIRHHNQSPLFPGFLFGPNFARSGQIPGCEYRANTGQTT